LSLRTEVDSAGKIVRNGGTIVYPTDTIWGIGCDATNKEAVEKISTLKLRPNNKSYIILLDSIDKVRRYVKSVPEVAYELFETAESPLTLILDGGLNLAPNVLGEDGSIGIRIIHEGFAHELIKRLNKPLVSTSANTSGVEAPKYFEEIEQSILDGVDYAVNLPDTNLVSPKASSIIKIRHNSEITILRK
jgi:L-threonylcarbamoyladenylate synthase